MKTNDHRLNLYLPKNLRDLAGHVAVSQGMSLAAYMRMALMNQLQADGANLKDWGLRTVGDSK